MHYERTSIISQTEAEDIFKHGSAEEIVNALLGVTYHDEDWQWVEAHCLTFLNDPREEIRAMAATCLGHLARIHGILHFERIVPALQAHLADTAGHAQDALDDIEMFVPNASKTIEAFKHKREN